MRHLARDHCLAPARVGAPAHAGGYGRLFPDLPAQDVDERALHALGAPDGPCDVGADFIDEPHDDASPAAVWPFFGQFVAHDITADRSPLGRRAQPGAIRNFRAPRADLEGVYGVGPVGAPYLYARSDPAKLLLGPGGHDVPRNHEGIALLGDPRNDVHLFLNGMQVAFIGLHNQLVDRLRDDGTPGPEVFEQARRETTWRYQHIILREFLPGLIGAELCAELLEDGAHLSFADGEPFIPFEFADAAYRYGHSQIRAGYQVNPGFGPCALFPDLMGFGPVSQDHAVDWSLHVDVPGRPRAQRSKRIDGRLPRSLIALPTEVSGERAGADYASLATRDLQRGLAVGLPSGEAVARRLSTTVLEPEQVGLAEHGWTGETPLWLYVLKEAHALHDGLRLGPVGGRIVGEVLVAIVDADPASFRSVDPGWTPAPFGLADVLVSPEGRQAAG